VRVAGSSPFVEAGRDQGPLIIPYALELRFQMRIVSAFPLIEEREMKMVAEYLEQAHRFERLARSEIDPKLKAKFQEQAEAYHTLAGNRARAAGEEEPAAAQQSNEPNSQGEPPDSRP
jgi:hypothetical protein